MSTTIAVSEALKDALEDIQDELEKGREGRVSLNAIILEYIQSNPSWDVDVSGHEKTLDEHVKVEEFTRSELKRIKNEEGFTDYEAVIRDRAGFPKRDTGEEPIEVGPLDG